MANDLVSPADLTEFPGAPFSESVVDSVVAAMRTEAGWHIAPSRTETVTLDHDGGHILFLPTLWLTDVEEVRDLAAETPRVVTGWRKSRSGMVSGPYLGGGFESVQVDITHGYSETPPELLLVIAERCQLATINSGVRQESAGGESISYSASGAITPEARRIFDRYRIPSGYR